MSKKFFTLLIIAVTFFFNCAGSITHRLGYPPADKLYVTIGDDPGSESNKPYIPKGLIIHTSTEYYLPIPILGLMVMGNANPQYVFYRQVIPKVRNMGGDAIIGARVTHTPRPPAFARFLGLHMFMAPSQTTITGQVVKR